MKKKSLISILLVMTLVMGVFVLSGCEKKEEVNNNTKELKSDLDEAKKQVEIAMKNWIKDAFGDEVVDSKINVTKVYTAEEEQEMDVLKDLNLNSNEVAFEVEYELKIADNVKDTIKFTVANGEFDAKTRWVTEKSNIGVLRPDGSGYKITDFGTGW